MNAELLYTSAPQGLKQGSRGFCTVLSTVGMPLNIATKLESLSGYRHLYPSGTPDATKNPISYSHLKLSVGGRMISVISRISDYGLDYSQRTNKIAHHIVVDAPGPTCGPAALLADPTVMRTQWDGNCVNVPTPPALPNTDVKPNPCSNWAAITGDAGWGGVLANAWLTPSSKPIFVVFSEDQSVQLVSLIQESIALLPPAKRWQATFGTYVTNLPPDVECKVRCVVAGSEEARMASARGIVINLTQAIGSAPQSEAVSAARNGTTIGAQTSGPPSHTTVVRDENQVETLSDDTQQADGSPEHFEEASTADFDPDNPFANATPDLPPSMRTKPTGAIPLVKARGNGAGAKSSSLPRILGMLGLTASILFIFGIVSLSWKLKELSNLIDTSTGPVESTKNIPHTQAESPHLQTRIELHPEHEEREATETMTDKVPIAVESVTSANDKIPSPDKSKDIPEPQKLFQLSKISIVLGDFAFPIQTASGTETSVRLGVIGAKAKAEVKYQSSTDEEQDRFQQWSSNPNSFKWLWYESDDMGRSWVRRSDINSSEIVIQHHDRPKRMFRVELEMENQPIEGAKNDEKIKVPYSNSVQTEDYTPIEIDAKQLCLKDRSLSIEPVFQEIKSFDGNPGQWSIGLIHLDRPTRLKDLTIEEFQNRLKMAGSDSSWFKEWEDSLSALKVLNRLRSDAFNKLDTGRARFRDQCKSNNIEDDVVDSFVKEGICAKGLDSLRSSRPGLRDEMGYFDSWDTTAFDKWYSDGKAIPELKVNNTIKSETTKAIAFNIQRAIFRDLWIGRENRSENQDSKEGREDFFNRVVQANSNFRQRREQVLTKEFFLDRPLPGTGLFSKRKKTSTEDTDLPSQEKAEASLNLWYRVKLKGQ